jgi:hypothetical protein
MTSENRWPADLSDLREPDTDEEPTYAPIDMDLFRANGNANGHRAANGTRKTPARRGRPPKPPKEVVPSPVGGPIVQADGSLAVNNPAQVADWLRDELGRGHLAGIFNRAGELVHTPREGEDGYVAPRNEKDSDGPAQIRPVDASRLASRCQYTYRVVKHVKDHDTEKWTVAPALFPHAAAKVPVDVPDMLPNVRVLRGVVHAPVLRPDGSLLADPGYDGRTGLLHLPEPGLVIPFVPAEPTPAEVALARDWLNYMLSGFVFASDSDRCNFLGLLVTPSLRALLPPPYKLGAIGAPMPGSGKSLLAAVLRIVHGGVFRAEVPEDEAELRKQVTTILDVTTGPIVQFDNATGTLRSATMAALLTSGDWDDRLLGSNKLVQAKNDRLWIVTGNNLSIGGDLIRRTLWVTIDPGVPEPHLRTGFAIGNLEAWVRDNRGQLLHAILVLARAWVAAGMPAEECRSDSYATWTAAMRGLLGNAGFAGEFDAAATARQQVGADDSEWAHFLAKAYAAFADNPWKVADLIQLVSTNGLDGRPIPSDALPGELADKFDRNQSISRSLGKWLANREGRWADNLAVKSAGTDRDGVRHWKVAKWQGAVA